MQICFTEWQVGTIASFIVLIIGISIQCALKFIEVSHSLKLVNKEITAFRKKPKPSYQEVNNKPNDSVSSGDSVNSSLSESGDDFMSDRQKYILLFIARNENTTIKKISDSLRIQHPDTLHHLKILEHKGFSEQSNGGALWNISPKGRMFLNDKKYIT